VVLQRFVAYIIDLTIVLQTLYLLCDSQKLTRWSIKLAVKSYLESNVSAKIHTRIKKYDAHFKKLGGHLPLSAATDQDTLDMIVVLMEECSIDTSEVLELRAKIPPVDYVPEEPW
jgi:hypothetical protein